MRIILLIFLVTVTSKAEKIKDNLIKLFPAFPQNNNDPRICTGIALNQYYFITTEFCAAQTSTWIHVHVLTKGSKKPVSSELIRHNPKFTVSWNNNIAVGNMPQSSSIFESLQILKNSTLISSKENVYTLNGFKSVDSKETFKADVTIQDTERCKTAKFSANKIFIFNETTEICAEITSSTVNDWDTFNYGSPVIDADNNNIVGLLSIMEEKTFSKKREKILAVLIRVSAYCDYIGDGINFKCS